jgi:hypothetical protein
MTTFRKTAPSRSRLWGQLPVGSVGGLTYCGQPLVGCYFQGGEPVRVRVKIAP